MTRKFKLELKKFIEDDGLKIIRNSKNEKEAINNLMVSIFDRHLPLFL